MSVTVTLTFETIEQAISSLMALDPYHTEGKPVATLIRSAAPAVAEPPAEKPAAKAKEQSSPAAKMDVTDADLRSSLEAVIAATDVNTAHNILKGFGAGKLSEIPADKRAEFVAKCEEACA